MFLDVLRWISPMTQVGFYGAMPRESAPHVCRVGVTAHLYLCAAR